MLYIIGINSFIAKHFYLQQKVAGQEIRCYTHSDLAQLQVTDQDTVINCCGVNVADTYDVFEAANHTFVKELVTQFGSQRPFLMHLSTFMVNGFTDQPLETLAPRQQFFIRSKKAGEDYLRANYPADHLCIVRPSNIYGYSCRPYYNNILVTLAHEKRTGQYQITSLNRNCVRNFLSVEGLCSWMGRACTNQLTGTYAVLSNNTVNLQTLVQTLYPSPQTLHSSPQTLHSSQELPQFEFTDGDPSTPNTSLGVSYVCVEENLETELAKLEQQLGAYVRLATEQPQQLVRLSQPRGDMVEISALCAQRLYMITFTEGSTRGNHYHYEQIEHFYQHRGRVLFLLAHADHPDVIQLHLMYEGQLLVVNPYYIHTLINDFSNNECEVFVTSTQPHVPNSAPDTKYINIV